MSIITLENWHYLLKYFKHAYRMAKQSSRISCEYLGPSKDTYKNVDGSFIHNSPKLEINQM